MTDNNVGDTAAIQRGHANREKGARNERQAVSILTMTGWKAERVACPDGETDPFHLVDVLGLPSREHDSVVKLVQVKTNKFPPATRRKLAPRARIREAENLDIEVWVREDRFGWHFHRMHGGEWERLGTVESCDVDEVADELREAEFYAC